ncbi:MAG: CPBP family intramembrane metalloprotease [Prevotella sp.]|nr:CPBP family intramembrane metalloprotease [Prevotella sp.]
MKKKTILRTLADVVIYLVAFLFIQLFVTLIAQHFYADLAANPTALVVTQAVSSVLTVVLFLALRWVSVSGNYIRTRPWGVLVWASLLTFGTIIPSEWLAEAMNIDAPEDYEQLMLRIMSSRWGYLLIGILVPVAEEMVFRGAILRSLLSMFNRQSHWVAIVLSAMIFGAVHGNLAQFVHATLLGLLLGWMYYRTESIFPGIVVHWVNNSIAYIIFLLMPGMTDARLIDLLQGDHRRELLYVAFSLMIVAPCLVQLHLRMRRAGGK